LIAALTSATETSTPEARPAGEAASAENGLLADQWRQVEMAKHAALAVAGPAVLKYGETLQEQQEVLAWIADLAIEIFAMESGLLRALHHRRPPEAQIDLVRAGIAEGLFRIEGVCRQVLAATSDGEELRSRLALVRHNLPDARPDPVQLHRRIAERLLDAGTYVV
jgi:hypothetical protein